ncbi:Ig-like domain-containing protein [uncultured Cloacibacillus sp.]|uniref:Ig-like domain-containing protein n=1 Tax=uncultured Cloacibacillus sp. TaxID=889794 RepID=UPI0026DC0B93|nr:Ig-like domain-containing protein [uncultured Cloacibacillus sp.]
MFSVFGMKFRTGAVVFRPLVNCLAAAFFIAAFTVSPSAALTRDTDGAYLIATSADLTEFRRAVNAGSADISARLTADIDLSAKGEPSPWTPIGNPVYCGTFDGGGHTVSGYVVTKAAYYEAIKVYYAGFFARIGDGDESGSVKNLILRGDVNVSADNYLRAGGLAGMSYGYEDIRSSISNCAHFGNVYGSTSKGTLHVGGLVGQNEGGEIGSSFHSGDVSINTADGATTRYYGVFAGSCSKALISNCGWQRGQGTGENYASVGIYDSSINLNKPIELSPDIAEPQIVTAITVSADIGELTLNDDMTVALTTAPCTSPDVQEYISSPEIVENSYNHDIIEVNKTDDLKFSITPRAAGKTPVTFTAELRPTDFAQLPNFMPVAESEKQQMSMTIEISVSEAPPLPDIRVEPPSADMTVGERLALVAVAANGEAFDDFVTWASGDESVVIVDADGMAAAVSKGSAAVTASTKDGRSAVCTIKVSEAPEVPDEPVISPVSPDVEPEPDTPGAGEPDVPPSSAPAPSSGGGCSAGVGFPAAAALAFLFFMKRK